MSGGARRGMGSAVGIALVLAAAWLLRSTILREEELEGTKPAVRPGITESASLTEDSAAASAGTPGEPALETAPALPPPVDLEAADRERDLHGVVVDEEGRPISGAVLEVERSRPGRGFGDEPHLVPQPEPLRALSAKDGTFRFRLDWGEQVDLEVRAAGYGGGKFYGCPAGLRLLVRLARKGGSLEVLVRDGEGAPVAGAKVHVGGGRLTSELTPHAEGVTDAAGLFACVGLAAGRVEVEAGHPEFGEIGNGIEAWVPASGAVRCEVVLDRGRAIEGRVVDAATDLPVAGARVGRGWTLERAVPTDAEGRFRFLGWNTVGGWHFGGLHCLARGYARQEVVPTAEGAVEFRLVRGYRAEGRVVGADGQPVALARVEARGVLRVSPGAPRLREDLVRGATGADGRFAFDDLGRDLPYGVSVAVQGHPGLETSLEPPPEGVDAVALGDLVLSEGRRVEGVVLDASGKPAQDVEVSVSQRGQARVDDRGRFRVADIPPGEHTFYVLRPDAYVLLETKRTVPPDADLRDLVLAIPAFRRLSVLVTDPAGRPLPGVEVYAYGEEDTDWKVTGEDGRVVLDQIKEEVVDVSAELYEKGVRPLRLQAYVEKVRPAGQEMVLVMEEGVPISGVVRGADGKAAGRVQVTASCPGMENEKYWERTDEQGVFYFRVREGLTYDLEATREDAEDNVLERRIVRQVTGPKEDVEILLEPAKE